MIKPEQLLPAITTTRGSDWRGKIKEIDKLGLKQVAIFPTCLKKPERQEMFSLLKQSKLEAIPLVHLRTDMDFEEIDWLIENYQTRVMNLHSPQEYKHLVDYHKAPYGQMIYLENVYSLGFTEEELKKWPGICLDFSHLENVRRLEPDNFLWLEELLKKYPIGCNHISAVADQRYTDSWGYNVYARHYFEIMAEFDYLKAYTANYFSSYIGLELENTLEEQLKVKDYIIDLLKS